MTYLLYIFISAILSTNRKNIAEMCLILVQIGRNLVVLRKWANGHSDALFWPTVYYTRQHAVDRPAHWNSVIAWLLALSRAVVRHVVESHPNLGIIKRWQDIVIVIHELGLFSSTTNPSHPCLMKYLLFTSSLSSIFFPVNCAESLVAGSLGRDPWALSKLGHS